MKDLKDQRVIILGAARQGLALARYLAAHGADVVLSDAREPESLAEARQSLSDVDVEWSLGGHPLELLDQANAATFSCITVDGDFPDFLFAYGPGYE